MGLSGVQSSFSQGGNGRGHHDPAQARKVAIVGSHPATRLLAPYDDPSWEIWLFNEAAQKPEVYRRWDALIQIHKPEVYTSLQNWVNKDHWSWLQQDHGDRKIWLQEVDPRVPNSVKYPLDEILKLIPFPYLRSSPAEALALAIYLGYDTIALYGSELTSNTEYTYQATNYAFWIGFALGRGIDLRLECWQNEFYSQPIYGYEGETQLSKEIFEKRRTEAAEAAFTNNKVVQLMQNKLDDALMKGRYDEVGQLILQIEHAIMAAGECEGSRDEAARYAARTDMISRQEFERVTAQAQMDGDKASKDAIFTAGKVEYTWNVWRQTGRVEAKNQMLTFLKQRFDLARLAGVKSGVMRENMAYMQEYDKVVTALGGERARAQVVG